MGDNTEENLDRLSFLLQDGDGGVTVKGVAMEFGLSRSEALQLIHQFISKKVVNSNENHQYQVVHYQCRRTSSEENNNNNNNNNNNKNVVVELVTSRISPSSNTLSKNAKIFSIALCPPDADSSTFIPVSATPFNDSKNYDEEHYYRQRIQPNTSSCTSMKVPSASNIHPETNNTKHNISKKEDTEYHSMKKKVNNGKKVVKKDSCTTGASFFAPKTKTTGMIEKNAKSKDTKNKKTSSKDQKHKESSSHVPEVSSKKKKETKNAKRIEYDDDDDDVEMDLEEDVKKGNADDFVGDVDEDEEFLEEEKARKERNAIANRKQVREFANNHSKVLEHKMARKKQKLPPLDPNKKRRKRVVVEETFEDEDGYLQTRMVQSWVDVSDNEDDKQKEETNNIKKPTLKQSIPNSNKKFKRTPTSSTQSNIMSFFAKK